MPPPGSARRPARAAAPGGFGMPETGNLDQLETVVDAAATHDSDEEQAEHNERERELMTKSGAPIYAGYAVHFHQWKMVVMSHYDSWKR